MDMQGRLVDVKIGKNVKVVDVSHLKAGSYFVKLLG